MKIPSACAPTVSPNSSRASPSGVRGGADAHAEFQALMRAWGTPDVLAEKERIAGAVLAGEEPQRYPAAPTRAARTAARVALRQMLHTHPGVPGLRGWLSVFDHGVAQQTPANDAED
jgi:hypothetical protein